jgi:hypothetical protein
MWERTVPKRSLWNLAIAITALAAVVSGTASIGHAAGGTPKALEPGFSGTFLYRNDNFRTGQNLAESVLTPSNVNPQQFGLMFTDMLDGAAYAEPLYVPNVAIPGNGTHNVVYVATENDSVYAFDADNAGAALWHTSFIDPANGITAVPSSDLGCNDLTPIIGITATPVIDSGTLYVVSKVKLGPGDYQQQLHALDITTGLERMHSPVTIAATASGSAPDAVNGVITFDPLLQNDRPALTISNGVVYLSFASHCDYGPYHGWILGYDETSLQQKVVFNTTPNGSDGGIWEAGCGPGVDTNGNLITITGNGTFDTGASPVDYGDSFLSLTPVLGMPGSMTVASFFTPLNEMLLADDDLDMGSGGNLLLPPQPGPYPDLVVGAGKFGTLYLVNRHSMGGFNAGGDQMVQEVPNAVVGMFSTPAYWQGMVPNVGLQNMIYTIGVEDYPTIWTLSNGMINTPAASTASNIFGFPGASPVISANGTSGGILWAINSSAAKAGGAAILYAYDATNLANKLYDSTQFASDNPGPAVKFTVPTVANGSVYVGTQTQLAVFGLLTSGRPSPPTTMTVTASLVFANLAVGQTVAKNLTVTNTGKTNPLVITSVTPSDSEFAATGGGTCGGLPITVATKTSCTIAIGFTPNAIGKHSASLTLTDNGGAGSQNVSASGTGIADMTTSKSSVSFPSVKFGIKSIEAFAVTNHQTQPVTLNESFSGPNAGDFSITGGTCTSTLGALKACTIDVTFTPGALGSESAMVTVTDSPDPLSPYTVALSTGATIPATVTPITIAYGTLTSKTPTKTLKVTVTNLSGFSLSLSDSISGTNGSDFTVTGGTCGSSVSPHSSCTVSVTFTPTGGGTAESASMAVSVSSDPGSPHSISLTGTGP